MNAEVAAAVAKCQEYCQRTFGGDVKKGFDHYASGAGGTLDATDIRDMLSDAGVGTWLTRRIAANMAVGTYGTNGLISWDQAQAALAEIKNHVEETK